MADEKNPAQNDNLTSDDKLALPSGPRKSRTLTRKPFLLIGSIVGSVILYCLYALNANAPEKLTEEQKAEKQAEEEQQNNRNRQAGGTWSSLNRLGGEGVVNAQASYLDNPNMQEGEIPPAADTNARTAPAPQPQAAAPAPAGSAGPGDQEALNRLMQENARLMAENSQLRMRSPEDAGKEAEAARKAEMELQNEIASMRKQGFIEGLKGKTDLGISVRNREDAASAGPAAPTAAQREGYDVLSSENYGGSAGEEGYGDGSGLPPPGAPGAQGGEGRQPRSGRGLAQYSSYSNTGNWDLGQSLEAPAGKYMVRAGMIIPCTLITGITSDTPGQALAQVSRDVYDAATGKYLLIPQGTRVVGTYASGAKYGQNRMLIAWQRLIYPDNKAIDLGSMPGSDLSGLSGFQDQVDNHWFRLLAGAFLMSGVTATVSVATASDDNSDSNKTNLSDEARQELAAQFGQVIANVISREMAVSPTLTIRPGFKFNITVTKDITFGKPYQAFDYAGGRR